ncbi:MAG TPA: carbohydrate ABC transporter permease [Caldilineaceae bacterium]|nr:carbohydrate ABC transporter permease [Caldilineaceae bacterium]
MSVAQSTMRARTGAPRWLVRLGQVIANLLIIFGGVSMLLPFLWMVITSFKTDAQVFKIPFEWIPNPWVWQNYPNMLLQPSFHFWRYVINSVITSVCITLGSLLLNSMAAYAFAKYRFPGREVLFFLLLVTIMIPIHITLIPVFVMIRWLGWVNTYEGLIVRNLAGAFGIFLMRQFFMTIPQDLIDAARMDAAGEFRIFWQIALPLSKPALATLGVFTFLGSWNEYLWPLIVISKDEMRTLPLAIAALGGGYYVLSWPVLMAGATFATLPVIVVFFLLQRYFVEGITLTGMKG